jgi:hypothetical protein
MNRTALTISPHAFARMAQRGINETQVRAIVERGSSSPEAAPAGAAPRRRCHGRIEGRSITVIVADEDELTIVITAY